jgi:polyisoprenyl-phosphate glycosyltransferase
MTDKSFVSIVIPVFNEATNIPAVYQGVVSALEPVTPFEILFIDDGSTDSSFEILQSLHSKDSRVKVVSFSRNFGHQRAVTAGMDYAQGAAVVVMDADLQHPPELLPSLIARWKEGWDIVYTVRRSTEDAGWFKRFTSACYYRLFHVFTGIVLPANTPDFRLMDRKVVEAFAHIRERARFMRGLTQWVGYRATSIVYDSPARRAGKTKYTFTRMLTLALDGFISFSQIPLHFAIYAGFGLSVFGFLYMVYALYARFVSHAAVSGWTSLIMLIALIGGIQLCILGIIGIYIGRMFEEIKQRPLYLVRETLGTPSH